MLSLEKLKPGDRAIINNISPVGAHRSDLMEMGLTKGTLVRLVKFAPLGDPLQIQIRGYHLSLRKSDAKSVMVQKQ